MLPDEILLVIFKDPSLDLNDLLQLRSACKRFNSLIVGLKITKLAVLRRKPNPYRRLFRRGENYSSQFFKFINEPIGSCMTLKTLPGRFLKSATTKQILSRLKQLSIDELDFAEESIMEHFLTPLEELKELESLQIHFLSLGSENMKCISLPTVRLLSIVKFSGFNSAKLRIDAPKLSKLAFLDRYPNNSSIKRLELVHPETLEEIETHCYHPQLADYSNLKTIRFRNEELEEIQPVESVLTDFTKLESLYFGRIQPNGFLGDENGHISYSFYGVHMQRQGIGELLRFARKRRNLNAKIYLMDFRVESQNDLDDLYVNDRPLYLTDTRRVLSNYSKLASVTTAIDTIHYADLMDHFGNAIPDDFHQQFINVRVVSLDRKQAHSSEFDHGRFMEFLEKCQVLNVLELKHVDLDTAFYSRLPLACRYLSILRIELEKPVKTPDLSFILNHEHLAELSINRPVEFGLIRHCLTGLNYFQVLKCEMNGKPIEIDCSDKPKRIFKISNKNLNSYRSEEFLEALESLFALIGPSCGS